MPRRGKPLLWCMQTPPNFHQSISNAAPRVQTSTLTPAPLQVLTSKTPTTFSSAFLRRCATDVSIRSRSPAKLYLKCISFITWRYVSVHDILSLIRCATTQTSLRAIKVSPALSCTDSYILLYN